MFSLRKRFKAGALLGNNQRLISYIHEHNARSNFPVVDDKVRTTTLLSSKNIPHPKTLEVIESISQIRTLHKTLKNNQGFVVKPARGAAGNGILIVNAVRWSEVISETKFITTRKDEMAYDDFSYYLSMILSGVFSLNGHKDKVLIQEKLMLHPSFERFSYKGIPDIRVIVYKGVPVMAMLRLPTKESGGRGNLHQGAVGCGVDLKSGLISHAVYKNSKVLSAPDFPNLPLIGSAVPRWGEVLNIAAKCSEGVGLGYLGVDLVIDPDKGPLVLEMNARPGLTIQLANQKGLIEPLSKVDELDVQNLDLKQRVFFAQNKL